jgi:uncharacterized RDD family membrane protein YckC
MPKSLRMETNNKTNVIDLAQFAQKKAAIPTFNPHEAQYIDIKKDKISQRRIYSFIVDFAIISVINTSIHVTYSLFVQNFFLLFNETQKAELVQNNLPLQVSVFILIYTTYFLYGMFVLNGQTPGKMLFKLRTIKDDFIYNEQELNHALNLSSAWRRSFGYLMCYSSFGTFFLFSLMSEDKRGFPDYFSNSRTVSEEWLGAMLAYKQYSHEEIRIDISSLAKAA